MNNIINLCRYIEIFAKQGTNTERELLGVKLEGRIGYRGDRS
jgi:hypothetical protein